ncbi:MAG: thrombospondin type 3 repeat-containing protein [Bdellovibrionota bacterium]
MFTPSPLKHLVSATLVFVVAVLTFRGAAFACGGQVQPDVNGTILVVQEDDFIEPSRVKYAVVIDDEQGNPGETVDVEVPEDTSLIPSGLVTGTRVKLHGEKESTLMGLTVGGTPNQTRSKFFLNPSPTTSKTGAAIEVLPEQNVALGAEIAGAPSLRKVIVIAVNFSNSTVGCTDAQLDGTVFTNAQSIAATYSRSSYGLVSYVRDTNSDGQPDIFRVTISATVGSTCDYSSWMTLANAAVVSQYGINPSTYDRRLYYLGGGVGACGWAGLGTIGPGFAFVNGQYCSNGDVAAHELGHNESMNHSGTDLDNNGVLDSGTSGEYGDTSDIMGYGGIGLRHFNAPHKIERGWMPPANVVTPTSNQSITLTGLEQNVSATQVIKVGRGAAGHGYYYVSYRIDDGVLTGLPSAYKLRTSIHWFSGSGYTYFVKSLGDGESFTDPVDGTKFTQVSHTSTTANISFVASGSDSDGDGIPDSSDNCPSVSNANQLNTDGDSQGDVCDNDDDNDGIADGSDCAPLDAAKWRTVAYSDPDGDGVRNSTSPTTVSCYGTSAPAGFTANTSALDNCPSVSNPTQTNTDNDANGDACDTDDDNDGTLDTNDCAPLDSTKWRNLAYSDTDGDGIRNSVALTSVACFGSTPPTGSTLATNGPDNCPFVSNSNQLDSDADGIGDACENDTDGDGVLDFSDCAPSDPARYRNQAYLDADGDGIRDSIALSATACFGATIPTGFTLTANGPDNCPGASNPTQADADNDGYGDACDSDRDNDGVANSDDCAPDDSSAWRNLAYADHDADGFIDFIANLTVTCFGASPPPGFLLEPTPLDNCPGVWNPDQEDSDSDGLGNACTSVTPRTGTAPLDFDGDGLSDAVIRGAAPSNPLAAQYEIHYSSTGAVAVVTFGGTLTVAAPGDYTGDGIADLASVQNVNGELIWVIRDSAKGTTRSIPFGLSGALVLSGCDFSGDGVVDAAVVQSGRLLYRNSRDGAIVFGGQILSPTTLASSLICADVTGDHRAEILSIRSKPGKGKAASQFIPKNAQLVVTDTSGAPLAVYSAKNATTALAIDLNRNGLADPAYVGSKGGKKTITVFAPGQKKASTLSLAGGASNITATTTATAPAPQSVLYANGATIFAIDSANPKVGRPVASAGISGQLLQASACSGTF